jgi:hypothetical protein
MDWKDLEKMTILKLREEALKHPDQIKGVHGKSKPQLMDELAKLLAIEKPHIHFTEAVVHTKDDLKHKIRELKARRDKLVESKDHKALHGVRREMHKLKRQIRRIEQASVDKT